MDSLIVRYLLDELNTIYYEFNRGITFILIGGYRNNNNEKWISCTHPTRNIKKHNNLRVTIVHLLVFKNTVTIYNRKDRLIGFYDFANPENPSLFFKNLDKTIRRHFKIKSTTPIKKKVSKSI